MKSRIFKVAGISALLLAMGVAQQAQAAGQIQLFGRIYSATCEVEINGIKNPSTISVPMGNYPVTDFATPGTPVGGTGTSGRIEIDLSNCPADKTSINVKLNASTVSVSGGPDAIELDNAGDSATAKNVGIYIYHENNMSTPLAVGVDNTYSLTSPTGQVDVNFVAKYVGTSSGVQPGLANATVNYDLTYN